MGQSWKMDRDACEIVVIAAVVADDLKAVDAAVRPDGVKCSIGGSIGGLSSDRATHRIHSPKPCCFRNPARWQIRPITTKESPDPVPDWPVPPSGRWAGT
jgi:hypothetical protein